MGQLVDIIKVTVSQSVASLLLPGFGIPLVLSPHSHYTDRVRYYTANSAGLAQMVTDGFSTTESAYLAASAIASQSPAPALFGIGRLANKPTQKFTYTPPGAASGAGVVYGLLIDGQLVTYTSVGADSVATIVAGLQTAFNALGSPPALTASIPGNANLTLTANAAGAFHYTQIVDANSKATSLARGNLSLAQTHADPGIAADMTAIQLADNGWYGVINSFDSALMGAALAAWVEANLKLYILCSVDDAILGSGSSDIASTVKSSAYTRTAAFYKSENQSQAQAAWMGRVLPLVAGSENWAYKTLAGVPVDTLSEGERSNAAGVPTANTVGKYASIYDSIAGVGVTQWGRVGSGSWLDITRGIDALTVDMSGRIFTDLTGANKIPYTDKGIAQIEKDVRASLAFYTAPPQNFLAESPPYSVSVPLAASLSSGQRASRVLPNVTWQANLAGAINSVQLQGTVIP